MIAKITNYELGGSTVAANSAVALEKAVPEEETKDTTPKEF
jgi:hypothetical protein